MFDERHSSSTSIGFSAAAMKDASGAYFIDRDGEIFAVILEFLRSGRLWKWPQFERKRILHEAEYFGVQALIDVLLLSDEGDDEEQDADGGKRRFGEKDANLSLAKMWRSATLARQGKR